MGRFIQADTVVPEPENPQAYNRYAYAANNPLKYNDPSGNFVFTIIAAVLIGAAIGAATAAATGGNILMGALSGAVSGLFGGIGAVVQSAAVALIGGAAAGAINSAIQGGNPLLGALSGIITGALSFGVGVMTAGIIGSISDPVLQTLLQGAGQVAASTIGGGIGAELGSGNFGKGALYGAVGGGIAFGTSIGLNILSKAFGPNSKIADEGYSDPENIQSLKESPKLGSVKPSDLKGYRTKEGAEFFARVLNDKDFIEQVDQAWEKSVAITKPVTFRGRKLWTRTLRDHHEHVFEVDYSGKIGKIMKTSNQSGGLYKMSMHAVLSVHTHPNLQGFVSTSDWGFSARQNLIGGVVRQNDFILFDGKRMKYWRFRR